MRKPRRTVALFALLVAVVGLSTAASASAIGVDLRG
jgi:hypothetical protein